MPRSKSSILCGLLLLAVSGAAIRGWAAGPVPNIAASRTISVATANDEEKPPVISCLAIDRGENFWPSAATITTYAY